MTTERTFEDLLAERFMKDEPESVGSKDDFEDNFSNWLEKLDGQQYMDYAEMYGREQFLAGMDRCINKLKE